MVGLFYFAVSLSEQKTDSGGYCLDLSILPDCCEGFGDTWTADSGDSSSIISGQD